MLTEFNPRVPLAHLPTPLEKLARFSEALGGPTVWIKRDDCTGLAGGGNKTRKLEYLLADALEKEADCVITAGGLQSNHVRQTAAAATRHGLGCHLVLVRNVAWEDPAYQTSGNILLDKVLGAEISVYERGADRDAIMAEKAEALRAQGKRPYVIPVGGSNAVGAMGYAAAFMELREQCRELGIAPKALIHATSSGGTQAGLAAAAIAAKRPFPVFGVDVDDDPEHIRDVVTNLLPLTLERLGWFADWTPEDVQVIGGYAGKGYGLPENSTREAIELLAQSEGILLDPVYSGKAMAALISQIRQGHFKPSDDVVFLHTGGAQALGAYPSLFE